MKAPLLPNEAGRLSALAEYHIIDSAPEEAFDDLTRLAAQICECPISTVTLIDKDRQWFKSKIGMADDSTARDDAFCAHAIAEPDNLMIVPDATRDLRFAKNRYVTDDPNIRFYAGMPLLSHKGFALGTLCVIDRSPRTLSPKQLFALRILGRQAAYLLELKRVSHALAAALDNVAGRPDLKL